MASHERRLEAARELAEWLRERFDEVIADVRLFGSVARGTDDEQSDIDLLVLVRRPLSPQEREELSIRAYDEDLKRGTVTQCIVRTVDAWHRPEVQCGGLAHEVEREGVPL